MAPASDLSSRLFGHVRSAWRVFIISIMAAVVGTIVGGVCVGAVVIALIQPDHDHEPRVTARATTGGAGPVKAAATVAAASRQTQGNPNPSAKDTNVTSPPAKVRGSVARADDGSIGARGDDSRHSGKTSAASRTASSDESSPSPRHARRRAASRARQPSDNANQAYANDGRPLYDYDYQHSRQSSSPRRRAFVPAQRYVQPPPFQGGGGFFGQFNAFGNNNY